MISLIHDKNNVFVFIDDNNNKKPLSIYRRMKIFRAKAKQKLLCKNRTEWAENDTMLSVTNNVNNLAYFIYKYFLFHFSVTENRSGSGEHEQACLYDTRELHNTKFCFFHWAARTT